ncbi:MAG: CRISPR-associated protein Cas4, partial [Dehalococcoidia bacterium]|nr:CRISPR-associated protein Cas4 [Dehalococcoidia bacterium]
RMLDLSKTEVVSSREFRVRDAEHGIYGLVDEILMTPDQYIIIDDKPGTTAYPSQINQVYGYCLAFKGVIKSVDNRRIIGALRKRGSNLIFWRGPFDDPAERSIASLVQHVHALMSGSEQFGSSDNPNKCRACSLKMQCDRALTS